MSYRFATNSSGAGDTYALGSANELVVPLGVVSFSTSSSASMVTGSGTDRTVTVYGFLGAATKAIDLNGGTGTHFANYRIFVGSAGIVDANSTAVSLVGGNNRITNYGQIVSHSGSAISLSADVADPVGIIKNYGDISAAASAVFVLSGGALKLFNYGQLSGDFRSVFGDVGNDVVNNWGKAIGNVELLGGDDRLINRGLIVGDILMDEGADLLDNRGGTIEGSIKLGDDADTFKPGASDETADGGSGSDTLDFSKSSSVKLALDGSIDATGWAKDDSYINFENLIGSFTGSDTLIGDGNANTLSGGGGNDVLAGLLGEDTLAGGAGNDKLTGGAARDTMSGGTGADLFIFAPSDFGGKSSGAGDLITDFNHAEKDRINLAAVDANVNVAKDQAFTFIGTQAFSNTAGELRYHKLDTDIVVAGDTNGDGTPDFIIELSNASSLVAGDFVL